MATSLRLAEHADARAIHQIMTIAGQTAATPDLYFVDTLEFVEQHIAYEGFIVVALVEAELAGFQIVRLPGMAEDNLGRELGLKESELRLVAHVESAAVLPTHRGHGIQRAMIAEAERLLLGLGYRWLMCTVHPENEHSLRNLTALGYSIVATKDKYGSYRRHVMMKALTTA